jgi:subfamily B ATP-binding cassette protein MsbA
LGSVAQHEADSHEGRERPVLIRLVRYARPYVALILVTFALSGLFSVGSYARAYLIKPVLDNIVVPSQSEGGAASGWLPDLGLSGIGAQTQAPSPPAEDEAKLQRLRSSIRESFVLVVWAALAIVFAMPLVTFSREYLVQYVLGRIEMDMKVDVCGKLLALPLRFHQDRQRGDVLARIMGDVGGAHHALSLLFGDFLQSLLMIAVGVGALLFVSWKLSLVMLVVGPLIGGVISLFGARIRRSARRRQEVFADVTQRLVEILSGIKVIKAFRAEQVENDAFARASHHLFRRGMKVVKNGILLVTNGLWELSIGDLAAFAGISTTLYKPVRSMAKGWVKLMDAEPSASRFFEVMDSPIEIRDVGDAALLEGVREGLRLRDVCFSYDREPVLQGVSFEVRAGEMVAIVGRTGSGKTTLIDLLLRFYDPTSGSIEIDGIDIRRISRDSLLARTAVVTQEPFLFDGSIRDNILYGRPEASETEVREAARAAYVEEFVDTLPEGYDTLVGAAGVRLSGGQRQRITIARAILRDPDILVFDEATSSLDSQSERYVQNAIEALLGGRTVFVIAHRLSTVRRADKIVVIEDGRVSQTGTHDELVRSGGLYRSLVELQNQSTSPDARIN